MTEYIQGTVLTCSHSDCDCRVRIESECHCTSDTASPYVCTCGAPMVEVTEESTA
jgi:metallothionein